MKHSGRASKAANRMLGIAAGIVVALALALWLAGVPPVATLGVLLGPLLLFAGFNAYFFRDPDAVVPRGAGLVVAPAHGTVDVVDEVDEPLIMKGRCRRVSIFLSVVDVHVQQAPVAGKVTRVTHTPGLFLNALDTESAEKNENVLIGFEATEPARGPVGVRLLAGLIARRIIPWVATGDKVAKGERISLIQFGSRVDLYLPLDARVEVGPGQKVVGGETVMARWGA